VLRVDHDLNPWPGNEVRGFPGGPMVASRAVAPLGQLLPYRRAAGEAPPPGIAEQVRERGWTVDLGDGGLGDVLLALAMVRALHEVTVDRFDLDYQGPRADLISRCDLPISTTHAAGNHVVRTATVDPVRFSAIPHRPPTWLDILDDDLAEVHAALPMRYYLQIEMSTGCRLQAAGAPAPAFISSPATTEPFHVVFVATTSLPARKNYGAAGFARIATRLTGRADTDWRFTLITAPGDGADRLAWSALPVTVLDGVDATACLDVFAGARLVIGNDTGLTHLAALTTRADGTGPQVVGLYSRHAHNKWITGSSRHHAIATPFSQMLAAADRCPIRDRLDDSVWNGSADLHTLVPQLVADYAGARAGWW
jgi:hypothetical protein